MHSFITISHDALNDDAGSSTPGPLSDLTATPHGDSSDTTRRNSVSVACLRCRRRKIRCTGLPGPCFTCHKFGLACIDPGKRKSRSRSFVEAQPVSDFSQSSDQTHIYSPRPLQLQIQTSDLFADDGFSHLGDPWSRAQTPLSPGCYSDLGPELDPNWFSLQQPPEPDFPPISRSFTFPVQSTAAEQMDLYSPIPSIQITSHDGSPMSSPALHPTFSLPIRGQEELPPLQTPQFVSTQMDYYSDFLSPTDQPPTMSRRASLTHNSNNDHVADWSSKVRPSKRRHTTCSVTKPGASENAELGWMLNSPRTTGYLKLYFDTVHLKYPFLELDEPSTPRDTSPFAQTSTHIKTSQRLLAAAIGAMLQHKSRDISARYVRNAMQLHKREDLDLFSSISGIHCAMLLAIYVLTESQTKFENEEDDTSHPFINLWLWNCQISAACIDLGLHEWLDDNDGSSEIEAGLYRNTFSSAWAMDLEISAFKKRPRALHAEDVDAKLLAWIEPMLEMKM